MEAISLELSKIYMLLYFQVKGDRLAFTSNLVEWIWRITDLGIFFIHTLAYLYPCVRMGKNCEEEAEYCTKILYYLLHSEISCILN